MIIVDNSCGMENGLYDYLGLQIECNSVCHVSLYGVIVWLCAGCVYIVIIYCWLQSPGLVY